MLIRSPLQAHDVGAVVLALGRIIDFNLVGLDKLAGGKRGPVRASHNGGGRVEDAGGQIEGIVRRARPDVHIAAHRHRRRPQHLFSHGLRCNQCDIDGPIVLVTTDDVHPDAVGVQRPHRPYQLGQRSWLVGNVSPHPPGVPRVVQGRQLQILGHHRGTDLGDRGVPLLQRGLVFNDGFEHR